jgi:hypothetical protein
MTIIRKGKHNESLGAEQAIIVAVGTNHCIEELFMKVVALMKHRIPFKTGSWNKPGSKYNGSNWNLRVPGSDERMQARMELEQSLDAVGKAILQLAVVDLLKL